MAAEPEAVVCGPYTPGMAAEPEAVVWAVLADSAGPSIPGTLAVAAAGAFGWLPCAACACRGGVAPGRTGVWLCAWPWSRWVWCAMCEEATGIMELGVPGTAGSSVADALLAVVATPGTVGSARDG